MKGLIDVDVGNGNDEVNDNERFILTKWGCLSAVLDEYNINIGRISGTVGNHIVEDFMDLMCKMGYCERKDG